MAYVPNALRAIYNTAGKISVIAEVRRDLPEGADIGGDTGVTLTRLYEELGAILYYEAWWEKLAGEFPQQSAQLKQAFEFLWKPWAIKDQATNVHAAAKALAEWAQSLENLIDVMAMAKAREIKSLKQFDG